MESNFKEEQKFTQWWLQTILIVIGLIFIYGIYSQLILDKPFGDNPLSDIWLIIFALFIFGLIILFWALRLKTEIDKEEIRINFIPLFKKTIRWKDVESAKIVNYGFIGGWGIRLFTKYGTAYNIKGDKGLALVLKNGKRILIGTQKEAELDLIIKSHGYEI